MQEQIFDFTGLKCPFPVLKARRALKSIDIGQTITVMADDTAAPIDFKHFCETAGHQLEHQSDQNGESGGWRGRLPEIPPGPVVG